MSKHDDSFTQSIKRAYSDYYGYAPRIRVKDDKMNLSGYNEYMYPADWVDVSLFWEFRVSRGKTEKQFFDIEDFAFLEDLYEEELYSVRVLAIILGVEYRNLVSVITEYDTIQESFFAIIDTCASNKIFEHNNIERDLIQWAELLGLSEYEFKYRVYYHGKHDILFTTNEEYFKVPFYKRTKLKRHRRFRKVKKIAPEPEIRCNVDYKDAKSLVVGLIVDAKMNVESGGEHAEDAFHWLRNECGGLDNLLGYIEELSTDSINYILEECYKYAEQYNG